MRPALALRTYNAAHPDVGNFQAYQKVLDGLVAGKEARRLVGPKDPCDPGSIKIWVWRFKSEKVVPVATEIVTHQNDEGTGFHTVAGWVGPDGSDPSKVWSKNGHRRVEGPKTGPEWRPDALWHPLTFDEPDGKETGGFYRWILLEEAIYCWTGLGL